MNKTPKWYYPENYEKYLLLTMTATGFFGFHVLMWFAYMRHDALTRLIITFCFILAVEAMLLMLMRKRDKYNFKVSANGIEAQAEGEIKNA